MTLRIVGWAIAAIGLILLVVSLTADLTGLGDDEGFEVGVQQGAGIALGLVLIVVGLALVRRKRTSGNQATDLSWCMESAASHFGGVSRERTAGAV